MKAILILALSLLTALPAAADTFPIPEFEAIYNVMNGGLVVGESTRKLSRQTGGNYVFESSSRSRGFLSLFIKDQVLERSEWRYSGGRIVPVEYLYQRHGGKKEREVHMRFDWDKGRVTNIVNNDPWTMALPPGSLDKQVYQIQVMLDLAAKRQDLSYQIADGGTLKTYSIGIEGEEMLKTPMGRLRTVKLQRTDDKRQTILWCATELHYLPVQITHVDKDGRKFVAVIKELKGMTPPAAAPGE